MPPAALLWTRNFCLFPSVDHDSHQVFPFVPSFWNRSVSGGRRVGLGRFTLDACHLLCKPEGSPALITGAIHSHHFHGFHHHTTSLLHLPTWKILGFVPTCHVHGAVCRCCATPRFCLCLPLLLSVLPAAESWAAGWAHTAF